MAQYQELGGGPTAINDPDDDGESLGGSITGGLGGGDWDPRRDVRVDRQNRSLKRALVGSAVVIVALLIAVAVVASDDSGGSSGGGGGSDDDDGGGGGPLPDDVSERISSMIATSNGKFDKTDPGFVDPCDDFFEFACGGFVEEIGDDFDEYFSETFGFSSIYTSTTEQQYEILADHFPFISTFFDGCVDTDAIDAGGLKPLTDLFDEIGLDEIGDADSVMAALGELHGRGLATTAFFSTLTDEPDFHYAGTYRFYLFPGGTIVDPYVMLLYALGGDDDESAAVEMYVDGAYFPAIKETFRALNPSNSEADLERIAEEIWELELQLAVAQFEIKQESYEDLFEQTAHVTPAAFKGETFLDMPAYLAKFAPEASVPNVDALNITFFGDTYDIMTEHLGDKVKNYLKWHTVAGQTFFLADPIRTQVGGNITALEQVGIASAGIATKEELLARFVAGGAEGEGVPLPAPAHGVFGMEEVERAALEASTEHSAREQYCLQHTISNFGDFLSHEWVVEDFPPDNKKTAEDLVGMIYETMGTRLENVDWLDEETRAAAIVKWQNIVKNVGYNSEWLEMFDIAMTGEPFADLAARTQRKSALAAAAVGGEVVRDRMPTNDIMTQNAFYYPTMNSINMLAGLMLEPFFDSRVPMMLNLASYGMVIGHEITHGFDNNGRLYNGTGAYIDWWHQESIDEFDERSQCLIEQYSAFVDDDCDPPKAVDGENTLGENIADHGGINNAWDAYKSFADDQPQLREDFTNDQLFFLYYAQGWCTVQGSGACASQLQDVHSPGKARVNEPLRNVKAFAEAYECAAGDYMGRSKTDAACEIW